MARNSRERGPLKGILTVYVMTLNGSERTSHSLLRSTTGCKYSYAIDLAASFNPEPFGPVRDCHIKRSHSPLTVFTGTKGLSAGVFGITSLVNWEPQR